MTNRDPEALEGELAVAGTLVKHALAELDTGDLEGLEQTLHAIDSRIDLYANSEAPNVGNDTAD